MSTFASDNTYCMDKEDHKWDVALDVCSEDKLRLECLDCHKVIYLDITEEQYNKLYEFIHEPIYASN